MDTIMKMKYVGQKEVVEGGTAFTILFSNIPLLKTLLKTEGCHDDAACVIPVVLLFLSMCLHVVIPLLVGLLAYREKQNENDRQQLSKLAGNTNNAGQAETDTERDTRTELTTTIKTRSETNSIINTAILVLAAIGILLNVIISVFELQ